MSDKPLLRARGQSGELRAGGRPVATFAQWAYRCTRDGWFLGARLRDQNDYLLDHGAEYEVRLTFEDVLYIGTDVYVSRTPGRTDAIAVVGGQQMERQERYARTRQEPTRFGGDDAIAAVRATRDDRPEWQRARGRRGVLVRQPGHPADRPWRR